MLVPLFSPSIFLGGGFKFPWFSPSIFGGFPTILGNPPHFIHPYSTRQCLGSTLCLQRHGTAMAWGWGDFMTGPRRHRRHVWWFLDVGIFRKKSGKNCWKNGRRHFFLEETGVQWKWNFVHEGCFVKETFDENESQKRFREETYLKMLKRSKGKN